MPPEVLRTEEISRQNGLEQTIDRYKQSASFLVLSEGTRSAYAADLAQFREYCRTQDISSISQIESEHIRNLRYQYLEGYAPATIKRKRASLSVFLDWAQTEGIIRPDITISFPIPESVGKRHRGILSAEQVDLLISKARNLRHASLILIALTTGANITEIVNLNTEDILKTGDGNIVIRFKGGVHKTQSRMLAVDKKAGSKIAEYIEKSGLKPEDPLFKGLHTWHGRGRLTRQGFNYMLNEYALEIGIENLSPRMLRDTFIANFTEAPHELDAILGRRQSESTRSTYSPRRLLKI